MRRRAAASGRLPEQQPGSRRAEEQRLLERELLERDPDQRGDGISVPHDWVVAGQPKLGPPLRSGVIVHEVPVQKYSPATNHVVTRNPVFLERIARGLRLFTAPDDEQDGAILVYEATL
jgi:hypothetical protein